ncbi:hypothetical protein Tco_1227169 [Tanacetum coccineum]
MDIPAISCPSCNANVESANYVFFECDIATDMWKLVFRWCDIPLFQASSWDSFNDWIISWHASKEKNTVLCYYYFGSLVGVGDTEKISVRLTLNRDLFDTVSVFVSFSWFTIGDHMKFSWNDGLVSPFDTATLAMDRVAFEFVLSWRSSLSWVGVLYANVISLTSSSVLRMVLLSSSLGTCLGFHQNPSEVINRLARPPGWEVFLCEGKPIRRPSCQKFFHPF